MPHRHEHSHAAGGKAAVQSTAAQGQRTTVRHLQACPGVQLNNSTPTTQAYVNCQHSRYRECRWPAVRGHGIRRCCPGLEQQTAMPPGRKPTCMLPPEPATTAGDARRLQDLCWADKTGCHSKATAQHHMSPWLRCGVLSSLSQLLKL